MSTPASNRVRVRREPERGLYGRADVDAVLDAGLVAHVAFVHDGQPICIPTLFARAGDEVLVHGSSASRTLRTLAAGVPACVTVTVVDGLVLARSVFEHSVNYRSAVLLGSFARVETEESRLAAYRAFTEKLLPGRWDEVRAPSPLELRATDILSLPIAEASAKVRTGPPSDDESEDAALDVWAGVVPAVAGWGEPVASPGLRAGIGVPESVHRLLDGV
ncbi:MAG TPA: pyridoxamine 5'-phosphate oxidase family protein [Gaiellaceae bacterium]|nr:pyridoxamine 5'-phosphate oxidase family protein [Gaiellaceae bacterium]